MIRLLPPQMLRTAPCVALGLLTGLHAWARAAEPGPGGKPNVVFILSDDQGAWALRSAGAKELVTPNLDWLAAQGATFTNAFVATPVCSPSRLTYLTGKMPSHHGLQFHLGGDDNARTRWIERHLALSQVLATNGYTAGLAGKWHLGDDLEPHAGFSYWRVLHGVRYKNPDLVREGRREQVTGLKTDLEADCALEFSGQNRDRPLPFNLYDESILVPLIWNHPGKIAAGLRLAPLVANYDFFPSLLDYLGIVIAPDPQRVGQSYVPFLRGAAPREWRKALYFEYAYVRGIRTERMKSIERTRDWPAELYDLADDPGETRNLALEPGSRERMGELKSELAGFYHRIGAPPLHHWKESRRKSMHPTARSGCRGIL